MAAKMSKVRITVEMPAEDPRAHGRIISAVGADFDKFRAAVLKVCPAATFDFDAFKVRSPYLQRPAPVQPAVAGLLPDTPLEQAITKIKTAGKAPPWKQEGEAA